MARLVFLNNYRGAGGGLCNEETGSDIGAGVNGEKLGTG